MINDKRIMIFGVNLVPTDRSSAPVARVLSVSNFIEEGDSVNEGASVLAGERVARKLTLPVSLLIEKIDGIVCRAVALKPLSVDGAKSILDVLLLAPLNLARSASIRVREVTVVFQAPSVHLAETLPRLWLTAPLDFAFCVFLGVVSLVGT